MPAKPAASPDDIEMSSILGAIKMSLPKTVAISGLLGALTYGALTMIAPKYQSQAELAIVAKTPTGVFGDPKASSVGPDSTKTDQSAINTHVRALQSPDLFAKVADDLKLKDIAEFNSALGPVDMADTIFRLIGMGGPRAGETETDRVLNALKNQLEVYTAKESRFIAIRSTATDPALSAEISNHLYDLYREKLAADTVKETDDQQKVMETKIEKLKPEVAAVETEAERYRGQINSFKGGNQNTGLNEQQLSELTAELTRTRATRGEAEARAKSAREMMKAGSGDALPDVQKSPLIQNLVQQRVRLERQISELSASLLPGHPRMRQLQGDLAGLKGQLTGEIAKLVDSLDKEAKVALGREDSIKKSLEELKSKVVSNAPEEAKLRELEANAKAKRTELESLQSQLESNRKKLDTRAQPVEAQLISKAQAASVPIFPKKLPNAALVTFASLLLGTFWTITKALFSGARSGGAGPANRKYEPSAANGRAEPALVMTAIERDTARAATVAASAASETLTTIADLSSRLGKKVSAQGGHRTLVTGETMTVQAGPEAIELAKVLASDGAQVILIDWSPSGEGLSSIVGTGGGKGLTEILLGEISFEDAVKRVPASDVHFISCGAALDDVDDDIDPDQLNLVLDALDEAYDHIIVAGSHDDARHLFEAIQGRFDTGVLVADEGKRIKMRADAPGTFLGFEVADIDVIHFERAGTPAASNLRVQRVTTKASSEVRPV